jgi:2-polyprenyl-6-methoxyphenol hydroxylase-like FAD-dependent oxidoreductase
VSEVNSVLVVGGGIAGLTLATALRERGIVTTVVELHDAWPSLGAGLSVQPNGLRVLRRLGLADAVVDAGAVIERWLFADQAGSTLYEIRLDDVWAGVGPCVGITRAGLQNALVGATPVSSCRLGITIESIVAADHDMSVRFTDGSTGRYDLVVGADGIHSAVREKVFGPNAPTPAGQISWRSVAPMRLPGSPSIQFWLGDRCFFGLCSVGGERTYGFGYVAQQPEHDPPEGRLARLRERFRDFGATVQDYLASLESDDEIHCSTIAWIDQHPWHKDGSVLIGDAAHASSPMMGQGGSLAMEDAWVLAELLASEPTRDSALASYTQRRSPRVHWVQQQSIAIAAGFNAPPGVRNDVLRRDGAATFVERYSPLTAEP